MVKNDNYVTGPDGTALIKLPKLVEDVRLWARKDGYVPMFAIWWLQNEPALAAFPEEFTYHMQKGTILAGIVKNDDGKPIEGVKIEARYDGKGNQTGVSSRAVFDAWLSEGESAVTTDSSGRWKLDNVPPGDDDSTFSPCWRGCGSPARRSMRSRDDPLRTSRLCRSFTSG